MNIPVILGSVREGRKSERAAKFMRNRLEAAGHRTRIVDFKVLPLPFVDCPKEPHEYNKQYPHPNVRKWSEIADAADGFVFVVAEYNHGYSAVLKNALDWLSDEFRHKAVGMVGASSGRVGAARAIEQLRPICENFNMVAVRETVLFGPVMQALDEDGTLLDGTYAKKVDGLLRSLEFWAGALRSARAA